MNTRTTILTVSILLSWLPFLSCESKLYPPTDPPTLSNILITSDSSHTDASTIREGDTAFVSVDVSDPENDPETLFLNVLSGNSTVLNNRVSSSRIFNGTTWETWFDTDGLSTGSYSLSLSAEDRKGNESVTVSRDFTITADERVSIDVSAGAITISSVSYILKDASPDEPLDILQGTGNPFRLVYSISNNTDMKIDILKIPFSIHIDWTHTGDHDNDPSTADQEFTEAETYTPEAVVSSLGGGETRECVCNVYILNNGRTVSSVDYNEAFCTATIY